MKTFDEARREQELRILEGQFREMLEWATTATKNQDILFEGMVGVLDKMTAYWEFDPVEAKRSYLQALSSDMAEDLSGRIDMFAVSLIKQVEHVQASARPPFEVLETTAEQLAHTYRLIRVIQALLSYMEADHGGASGSDAS